MRDPLRAYKKPVRRPGGSAISNRELAAFLLQISDLYGAPPFGHGELALALRRLAQQLRRSSVVGQGTPQSSSKQPREPVPSGEELKSLTEEQIRAFIADSRRTKDELIELASVRFSMPRSQLRREKAEYIRHAINSALLHETSIDIIGQEASRGGSGSQP